MGSTSKTDCPAPESRAATADDRDQFVRARKGSDRLDGDGPAGNEDRHARRRPLFRQDPSPGGAAFDTIRRSEYVMTPPGSSPGGPCANFVRALDAPQVELVPSRLLAPVDLNGSEPRTAAVVGGSGFIGRSLIGCLNCAGFVVRDVDIVPPQDVAGSVWVRADVADVEVLTDSMRGAEVVYNLAGARGTEEHSWETFRTSNIEGARNVCAAATRADVRHIVFVSTGAVYGREDGPDESSACKPRSGYGRSKLAAEGVYRAWMLDHTERRLTVVRPSVVFGPGDRGSGYRFFCYAADPACTLVGTGMTRKSLAFVENLAAFLVHVLDAPAGYQLFNYCDRPDMTVREIVHSVRSTLGLDQVQSVSPVRAHVTAALCSFRNAFVPSARPGILAVRRSLRERRFEARHAHESGFVQPFDLSTAVAETARRELGWVSIVHRT